ncbi:hypothetical protein QO009_002375 [Brevibacillus aydinogluensis]|uniref:hypothetical protein n=1 Tax=Brevibacillus aydinogluensis TaxID=927786 RepID=UPI0028934C9E|nr:hypothetical protein [Brevibacillus aydinogluensis]MDT3416506.1 hypothetical protein [Brevibacillus aydinogluensis]
MKMSYSLIKQRWNREGKMAWGKWAQYSLLGIVLSSLLFTLCVLAFQAIEPAVKPLFVTLWQAASLPPEQTGQLVMTLLNVMCHFVTFSLIVHLSGKKVKQAPFKVGTAACVTTWLVPWLYYSAELVNGTGFVTSLLEVVEMLLYVFTLFLAVYLPYERFIKEAPQGTEQTCLEHNGLA